jgi:hypothetical protein
MREENGESGFAKTGDCSAEKLMLNAPTVQKQ